VNPLDGWRGAPDSKRMESAARWPGAKRPAIVANHRPSAFALLCSFLPPLWMATTMHNSNDYDHFSLDSIIDSKRKTMNQSAAGMPVNYRIHAGIA
jgi:hypothetical protein